jgi:eukaryotic-like serine/threonine-protein kinase
LAGLWEGWKAVPNQRVIDERSTFLQAIEILSMPERSLYVDRACEGDPGLREAVDALLGAHERPMNLLDVTGECSPTAEAPPPTEGPGTAIGPYTLMEQIGEGGMGVVYVAEQRAPVRRKVALKVIKPGMDSKQVVARFEAERQALALMDHPNIAKVHDAGTTASGRPYFVMELVRGLPITEYCDREQLSIAGRLDLLVLVCRAVQHAHQKGVIHRDLKPSNVLVTLHDGIPVPKVIDFGVAKAIGQGLTDKTIYTEFSQLVGTPLYMSPEQAELSGLDIDTRSDIYSLGVLLYELLTGTTPFDSETLKRAAFDEMRRIIREEEPPKPSTRLSSLGDALPTVSCKRSADPRRLNRAVRGELDWIVMKALEKDRRRRYETANDFAADVMRYLTDRPVEACPPSRWYRFTKYARRNRVALTTAAVVSLALVAGTIVSTWQAHRATRAEAAAAARAEESGKVLDYLVEDVFGAASPEKAPGHTLSVQELLTRGEGAIADRFAGRPLVEASARIAMADAFSIHGRVEEGQRQSRRAWEVRSQLLGPDHPDTLKAEARLVRDMVLQGIHSQKFRKALEAEKLARHAFETRRRVLGPEHADTLESMLWIGLALRLSLRNVEALDLFERAHALHARILGPNHRKTLWALDHIANTLMVMGSGTLAPMGRSPETEPRYRALLEARARALGPDDYETHLSRDRLAEVLWALGRLDEAVRLKQEAWEGTKRILGPTHLVPMQLFETLDRLLRQKGDTTALREAYEACLRECVNAAPPLDPEGRRRVAAAIERYVLALTSLPPPNPFDADLVRRAADQAAAGLEQDLEESKARSGADHDDTLKIMDNLFDLYGIAGKLDRRNVSCASASRLCGKNAARTLSISRESWRRWAPTC